MTKKAIIYYSMQGNTDYVAKYISKKIGADLIRIIPKKEYPSKGLMKFFWGGKSAVMNETPTLEKYKFDIDKYDHIIIGSPVWASRFTPPIRTFINENINKLKGKHISAFLCYSGGGADKALDKLKETLAIDSFYETLILIDPKNKKTEEKDKYIEKFCNKIEKKGSDKDGNTK